MKRNRVSITETTVAGIKQNQTSSQRKATLPNPKKMRKNISVNMVYTKGVKEHKVKEKAMEEPTVSVREIDLETPDQSTDGLERKTTKPTPMPNAEEQENKTIEFSPIDIVDDPTSNTPEMIKDDSQTKRTSFTETIAAMVGMKPKEKEDVTPTTEKFKTFGTISATTTEANQDEEQVTHGATAYQEKTISLELGDLMAKLEQIDKKLKYSEEDRQDLKKEIRHNENENLDNCFNLARATEEKLQQMSDKVEATDKEREKLIKKEMEEMKKRYDTVNEKLWNLDTRMDAMGKEQAESSCAIQSKLDALLRNSLAQDKLLVENPSGTRFVEPQRTKRESTPLARTDSTMKVGVSNTTRATEDSGSNTGVQPDAMPWANTWEMMNRTLEAFATRNTDSGDRGSGKFRKTFKKPKEFKDDLDGCIDTWVEVRRLHLKQDNLNDERQACTAILSNLEGTALKCVVAKKGEERDTADKIFEILLNRIGSGMKGHQAMMRFEKRRQRRVNRSIPG